MKQHNIYIVGPIGNFGIDGHEFKGVSLLSVVAQVAAAPEGTREIVVNIETPGGRKDVGDAIYNYLISLWGQYDVTMKQTGPIGSIGTKIWFGGKKRLALKGEKMWFIHNPWVANTSGNADALEAEAKELRASEEDLQNFYMSQTGLTKEALSPLMKAETEFSSDEAVSLKFATDVYMAHKIAAYKMTTNKKENDAVSLLDRLLNVLKGNKLALVVELEGGKKLNAETEDASKLEGVAVSSVDDAGNPSQEPVKDGEMKLKDGRKITVAAGKITKVEAATTAPAAAPAGEGQQAMAGQLTELLNLMKAQKPGMTKEDVEKIVKETLAASLTEIKNGIKTSHTPPSGQSSTSAEDVKEWDRSFKAGEHMAMRKNDPEKYKRLYLAKYGKVPTI
jgi:ATP-dependent Clp protease, protease subunit